MNNHSKTILETFELLGDWEERYKYLIDLGKTLEPYPDEKRTDVYRVQGCTSRVWLVALRQANGHFSFLADSDAHIVRGLIAVLLALYQNQSPAVIRTIDVHAFFEQLGLSSHLSPNRRNGFFAIADRINRLTDEDLADEVARAAP